MGNICKDNPKGNSPRYPLMLGEVDRHTGCLIRDSLAVIDDIQPSESPKLTLSNFLVREERGSGDLLLHLTRLFANDFGQTKGHDWTADAWVYRITV